VKEGGERARSGERGTTDAHDGFGEFDRACSSLGEVARHDGVAGTRGDGGLADELDLGGGVRREVVTGGDRESEAIGNRHSECVCVRMHERALPRTLCARV